MTAATGEEFGVVSAKTAGRRRRRPTPQPPADGPAYVLGTDGQPLAISANATQELLRLPPFFVYDEFADRIQFSAAPPWKGGDAQAIPSNWEDHHYTLMAIHLQANTPIRASTKVTQEAVIAAAMQYRRVHPVRDWLDSLKWDGEPRLSARKTDDPNNPGPGWLTYYLGAPDTPYVRAVGRKFLIGAVARIFKPGCKLDTMLILEGPQGVGKSTVLSILGGHWYTDQLSSLQTKDASSDLRGAWFVEMSELINLGGASPEQTKSFLSRSTDRYRPAYGKTTIDQPRQCVFAGSTNATTYLNDPSGGRRFWPVPVGERLDLDGLRANRDQLFAEAAVAFRARETWWIEPEDEELLAEATEEQASRFEVDPWEAPIAEYLDSLFSKDWTTTEELLRSALQVETARHDQKAQKRVAVILRRLGWESTVHRIGETKKPKKVFARKLA